MVSACMQLTCIERHARKLHRRQPLGSTQLATKHLMREAIKGHQIRSSAISTGRSRASGMMMDAIKASGMMMDAIKGNQRQSDAIKGNQAQSVPVEVAPQA